jgi:hypothetical protein
MKCKYCKYFEPDKDDPLFGFCPIQNMWIMDANDEEESCSPFSPKLRYFILGFFGELWKMIKGDEV